MSKSTHPVDQVLPFGQMLAVGIQHVLVMYAGAIAVPLIIGGALKLPKDQVAFLISSDLFACGIVTLIQCIGIWKFGIRLPVIMGVSFAPVGPMVAMANSGMGLPGIFGAVIAAGIFGILIAPVFGKLIRFFPPVVTGSIIAIIGVTLFPVAINWAGGGKDAPNFGDPKHLLIVALVLGTILLINKYLKGFIANISVLLLGMLVGFVIALAFGLVSFSGVEQAAWFAPVYPFAFGRPTFDIAAIASLCLVMVVIMVESLGMFLALGDITERPVGHDGVARGLRTDGLGTLIGGIFNTFPHSSFSQNIGLVGITGVRSRWVVVVSGVILASLGLLPKISTIIASIPVVVGGAGIAMFGMVAATGVKILSHVHFDNKNNLLIVAVSFGLGMIPLVAPTFFHQLPTWTGPLTHSGITLTAISAIVLNALFNRAETMEEVERELAVDATLGLEHPDRA